MKKIATLLLCVIAFFTNSFSQAPLLNWAKIYDKNEYSVDSSSAMAMDINDKSIYIGVTSDGFGTANDIIIIKRDYLSGDTIWTRRFNGSANGDDQFADFVINQNTGDIYVTGKSQGIGTGYDIVTIKYSSRGNLLWTRIWDNNQTHKDDFPTAIELDFNGNVYVGGSTYNQYSFYHQYESLFDILFLRYDENGKIFKGWWPHDQYNCTYFKNGMRYNNNYSNDYISQMKISNNGEIFYTVNSFVFDISYALYDCLALNLANKYESVLSYKNITPNSNGWYFNNVMYSGDEIITMDLDNTNNAYFANTPLRASGDPAMKYLGVYKLGKDGSYIFHDNLIVGEGKKKIGPSKIKVDLSGNTYIVGYEENETGDLDLFISKLDTKGNKRWHINKEGEGRGNDVAVDLDFDTMQNPVIIGSLKNANSKDELVIFKLDKNTGKEIFSVNYDNKECDIKPFNVIVDSKNNIIVNGIEKYEFQSNVFTIKYSSPIADAGPISGKTNVCQGENELKYNVAEIENAASYLWSLPDGATGNSTTNSITVSFDSEAKSGDITVKGINNFGEGKSSKLPITILPQPKIFAGNDTSICSGSSLILNAKGGNTYEWDNNVKQNLEFTPSTTKTYTVIGSNGLCQNSDQITVNVNERPTSPLIYLTDGVLYSMKAGENFWFLNNELLLKASNSYTPTQSGDYYAIVKQGECESLPSNTISFIKTSINEINKSNNCLIYPNPTTGIFYIDFKAFDGNKDVSIYDVTGKLLKRTQTDNNQLFINLTNEAKGLYLIRINAGQRVINSKIELK